jgi:hypothetical protein
MNLLDESKSKIAVLKQQLKVYKHLCEQQALLIQELKELCVKYKAMLDNKEFLLMKKSNKTIVD